MHQEIRQRLTNIKRDEIVSELSAKNPGTDIIILLETACSITNASSNETPAITYIKENPEKFCSDLASIKLGDEKALLNIKKHLGDDLDSVENRIRRACARLYVDILGRLPATLSFLILIKLDNKSIGRVSTTSKTWNSLAKNQFLWKWLSNHLGWGVVFTTPKNFDWRTFYQTMYIADRDRKGTIKSSYIKEMHGATGLK